DTFAAPVTASDWSAPRLLFVGGGARAEIGPERLRRMAATAVNAVRQRRLARLAWADVEPGRVDAAERLDLIAEGFTIANFDGAIHQTRGDERFFVSEAVLLTTADDGKAAADRGKIVGDAVNSARVLIN